MNTPVYFISDIHLKLSVDDSEKKRRAKLYRLFDKIIETGGSCFSLGRGQTPNPESGRRTRIAPTPFRRSKLQTRPKAKPSESSAKWHWRSVLGIRTRPSRRDPRGRPERCPRIPPRKSSSLPLPELSRSATFAAANRESRK